MKIDLTEARVQVSQNISPNKGKEKGLFVFGIKILRKNEPTFWKMDSRIRIYSSTRTNYAGKN